MIGILGDGSMAQDVAHLLQINGVEFKVFSRKKGNIHEIAQSEILFTCVPSPVLANMYEMLENINIVNCAKGIATEQHYFISSLFNEKCFALLSGPNFASEIIANQKTITTIASKNNVLLNAVRALLSSNNLDIETTQNVQGVEICGILKNAIAILMGFASVKHSAWNARSLMLTKFFQEMSVVLHYFKCSDDVLSLSCGIGDLFLTCSTANSRNFQFGVDIANGINYSPNEGKTIEGIRSLKFLQNINLQTPYFNTAISLLNLDLAKVQF